MKPIYVRFRCFGPYVEEQTVSFEELAEYGLFLICGETGAGKTAILDAICCALYGNCSGEKRGDLEAMRCKQAAPEEPTEVEFVFECDGRRYCFERRLLPRKRRKAEESITYHDSYSCRTESGGTWIPLLDNAGKRNMTLKAEELIGLNQDQFRQVIILPQGRFETLLTSGSEEKENILASLFHTERWNAAVEIMVKELNARKAEIDREEQTIRDGLDRLKADAVSELPEKRKNAERAAAETAEAEKKAETEKNRAQALLQLGKEFEELDRRRKILEKAQSDAGEDLRIRTRLEMAEKAEKVRPSCEAWGQAGEELKQASNRLKETEEELARAEAGLQKAAAEKEAHEALTAEQQRRTAEQQRLSGLRERYRIISLLQRTADTAKTNLNAAGRKAENAKETAEREKEKQQHCLDAWNKAGERYSMVSRAYQAATAGHLAASLREDEPCPVCGSRHHPSPARLPEGAAESGDVEAAEVEVTRTRKAYEEQTEVLQKAGELRDEAVLAFAEAQSESAKANGALQQELAQRDPELETQEDLELRIRQLEETIRDYEEEKKNKLLVYQQALEKSVKLTGALGERKRHLEEARAEYREKEAAWQTALIATGLGTETQYRAMTLPAEQQQKLRRTLSDHEAALKNARILLEEQLAVTAGKERPDSADAERIYREAEQQHKAAIRDQTIARQNLETLQEETDRLTVLDAAVSEKRKAWEEDSAFTGALRGSKGISIQRYVLGVRLGQVIAEANRLLENIYGGRYRLHRSNTSYGTAHKSGLELEVYDSLNDQHRSVCTLSGGEKFLAALSLAIGLCTVVQNEQKGVSLEAMFIDEGFGSLDQSSLSDALDVLQSIQRGRGLVGIISHIPLLEETIPAKIEIVKTTRGSKILPHLG